jgi:acyl-CoA reductase-like NAD-dependent aldehyde dehydrogenase
MTSFDHWINGASCPPASGRSLPTIDPTTREASDSIAAGSAADVDLAVAAALAAQPAWAQASAAERSRVLHAIADAIDARREEFIELERRTTGKTDAQTRGEIIMSADYFRYYAGVVRAHGGRTIDQGAGALTYTRSEPYGVVAIITPWNFPLNQAARACAPALAVGNAVVLKPSEFTSATSVLLAQVATEVGLANGVLNVVTGTGADAGQPLVSHPDVRRIAFTGSVGTGRMLASIAAEKLIPLTLELGGKSPLVVFEDADLDKAADAAVTVMAANAGQVCSAATRLIAQQSVHDELLALVVERAAKLQPAIDFGAIITEAQFERVLQHFANAAAVGAVAMLGAEAYSEDQVGRGMYIKPTVYANVDPDWPIARDEVFGPCIVTMTFTDEADAIARANDTEYGLSSAVWSRDTTRALRVAEQIQAGQVAINGGPLTIETPFGGFKNSGYGREKGLEALDDYAQIKCISLKLTP